MANKKITDLSAASELTGDDLFPVVDAPGGTATTKKVTADVAGQYLNSVNARVGIGMEWTSNGFSSFTTTATFPQDSILLWPTYSPHAMTISNVRVRVNTGAPASTVWRLGLYTDVDGTPTALIADLGTVDPTTSGVKNISGLSIVLPYGRMWFGVCMQGTASTGGTYYAGISYAGFNASGSYGTPYTGWTSTSTFSGALPATFAGASNHTRSPLVFGFQRSA